MITLYLGEEINRQKHVPFSQSSHDMPTSCKPLAEHAYISCTHTTCMHTEKSSQYMSLSCKAITDYTYCLQSHEKYASVSQSTHRILRASDQNGVSLLYIMLEIHHSGRESLICLCPAKHSDLACWPVMLHAKSPRFSQFCILQNTHILPVTCICHAAMPSFTQNLHVLAKITLNL